MKIFTDAELDTLGIEIALFFANKVELNAMGPETLGKFRKIASKKLTEWATNQIDEMNKADKEQTIENKIELLSTGKFDVLWTPKGGMVEQDEHGKNKAIRILAAQIVEVGIFSREQTTGKNKGKTLDVAVLIFRRENGEYKEIRLEAGVEVVQPVETAKAEKGPKVFKKNAA